MTPIGAKKITKYKKEKEDERSYTIYINNVISITTSTHELRWWDQSDNTLEVRSDPSRIDSLLSDFFYCK